MTNPRDAFLNRVRQAVAQGNRAGAVPPLPARGQTGYQGAGGDPVQHFAEQLAAAGGLAHVVESEEQAVVAVLELIEKKQAERILLGRGPYLDPLRLAYWLKSAGLDVQLADEVDRADRDVLFRADLGISAVDYLIAETGSVVAAAKKNDPRSVSLLPPIHIAIASAKQILPDLFDLFEAMQLKEEEEELPSSIALITGPSKTGDIELKLVTGVHGPGEVHVVVMRE